MRTLITLASLVLASGAFAGKASYQCQVKTQLSMDDKTGELKRPPKPSEIGKRFAIDRKSAKAIADDGIAWAFAGEPGQVLAVGNADNSFIATYQSPALGGGVHFVALRIEEFKPGPLKPFVMLDGGTVYSGHCE